MHDLAATNTPDDTTDGCAVRVVLVGRTGLDAALRLDREVELVRARTPLSALGELANPIDADSPGRAVVVVGPDALTAARSRAATFSASLRRIDPTVRVLGMRPADASAYDGVINHDATPEQIRSFVRNGAAAPSPTVFDNLTDLPAEVTTPHTPAPAAPPASPPQPSSRPQTSQPAARTDEQGDEASTLLALALRGGDIAAAALTQVRDRLGAPGIQIDPPLSTPIAADGAASIIFGRNNLGTLIAPGVAAAQIAREAAWLAHWLMLARQHEQLRAAAFTDELTGAWNRRYFRRFLAAAIEQGRQARHAVTVLFFDIDDFKRYNDNFGHAAGDEILVNAIRLLNSVIRPSDRVCRIGGDEFAVIFHDPDGPRAPEAPPVATGDPSSEDRPRPMFAPPSITDICQRFQKQICEHRFPQLGEDAPGRLTISGGLATYPWDGHTVDELLARADQLALQSKKQGKNAIILGPNGECARGG